MSDKVKNGTSLSRIYELVVLQKIRDAKQKEKKNAASKKPEQSIMFDSFGQMIY